MQRRSILIVLMPLFLFLIFSPQKNTARLTKNTGALRSNFGRFLGSGCSMPWTENHSVSFEALFSTISTSRSYVMLWLSKTTW